jgi:hypothetical protein
LLVGDDDPDYQFAQGDSHNVEEHSRDDAVFEFVDGVDEGLVVGLVLDVDVAGHEAHEVGRGSHVGFVVEVVHEVGLHGKFRVGDGVAPVVDHDQDEGRDD